jgi:hypothetical protein
MISSVSSHPRNYLRIASQSALAAALCLGFPAGLLLWLIVLRQVKHSAMVDGLIGAVTLFIGLAYGLILRSVRAALVLGLATSLASVPVLLLTIFVFDWLGLRVGTGNLAMPNVTAVGMALSAIIGGMVLGVGFAAFHKSSSLG